MTFDYSLDFNCIDFRKHPELYRVGKGEQGVLLVEPYKSEILPHWRFKTPKMARVSANKIYKMFLGYKAQEDFVGMDMARKFLQMGYSRARRYATVYFVFLNGPESPALPPLPSSFSSRSGSGKLSATNMTAKVTAPTVMPSHQ